MRQIDYKIGETIYETLQGAKIKIIETDCPYDKLLIYDVEFTTKVNSNNCTMCKHYIAKIKNKNSILCEGDEISNKQKTYPMLLTETAIS
jgi:hypothetical protein